MPQQSASIGGAFPPEPGTKVALRRSALAARRTLSGAERADASDRLATTILGSATARGWTRVCAYVPTGSEPGDVSALEALTAAGVEVLLPLVRSDRDLEWAVFASVERMRTGPAAALEPTGPSLGVAAVSAVPAVLVPALLVDVRGVRLGRGAGCYDRALARTRPSQDVLAVVFDHEVVARLPEEHHDVRVTGILTPRAGLRPIAGSP